MRRFDLQIITRNVLLGDYYRKEVAQDIILSDDLRALFERPQDYFIEVQRGNIEGASIVHKFGRHDAVPNGSWEMVNLLGTTYPILTAATTVRIKAGGNANDTAAGSGAQQVVVQGINATGAEVSETIATAGGSASTATGTSFLRVHRAWVSIAGSGGVNEGNITIENGAGGTDLIQIAADEGQSQFAMWSVPTGKTAYLLGAHCTVDAGKAADLRMFSRANYFDFSAAQPAKRLQLYFDGVLGNKRFIPHSPLPAFPTNADIWWEARGGGAGTEASVDFELLVIDD